MPKIVQNGISYSGSAAPFYKEVTGTLTTGSTTITLSDASITTNSTIDVYVDPAFTGVMYSACTLASGSVTLTFPAQSANMPVKVRIS